MDFEAKSREEEEDETTASRRGRGCEQGEKRHLGGRRA